MAWHGGGAGPDPYRLTPAFHFHGHGKLGGEAMACYPRLVVTWPVSEHGRGGVAPCRQRSCGLVSTVSSNGRPKAPACAWPYWSHRFQPALKCCALACLELACRQKEGGSSIFGVLPPSSLKC